MPLFASRKLSLRAEAPNFYSKLARLIHNQIVCNKLEIFPSLHGIFASKSPVFQQNEK